MFDYRMSGESGRIFPRGFELQGMPRRALGAALVLVAAIGWLSLLTWSIGDPSLNRATDGAPGNLLGMVGATLADFLLQLFGLASITLFLPPAVWGLCIASGERIEGLRQRLLMLAIAIILIASALSLLPQPKGWVLTHGLGGVIGDLGRSFFLRIGSIFSATFASMIGAIISGYIGLWVLVRACGIGFSDFRLLWRLPARGSPSRAAVASRLGYLAQRTMSLKDSIVRALDREALRPFAAEHGFVSKMSRRVRRSAEGSYDPRFGGFEPEEDYHVRQPRPTARPAVHRAPPNSPAPRDPSRVEPFFDAPAGYPAPEPGHRLVRILPMHAQQRPPSPLPPSPAELDDEPEYYPQPQPYPVEPQQRARAADHRVYAQEPRAYGTGPSQAPRPLGGNGDATHQQYLASQRMPAQQPQQPPHWQQHPLAERRLPLQQDEPPYHSAPQQRTAPPPPYGADPYDSREEVEDEYDGRPMRGQHAERHYTEPRREERPQSAPHRQVASRPGVSPRALILASEDELEGDDDFQLPALRLLTPAPERRGNPELSDTALGRKAEMLHGVLEDFGIKGTINGVHPGPVITLFELEPARGTKSSRVIGLSDDIARSMSAVSARVAVIPGRDAIGIELPNQNREMVFLRELLESPEFAKSKTALPLALGKTISGAPVIADLARMPHLLIAGTTGSGKSVAINAMILSLLYRLTPDECRFILIDPKMLELSVYDDIPHLLTPVVTDPRKAIAALKWTVGEMNVRYERMCKLGVRNITGFNQKVTRAKAQGRPLTRTVQTGFDDDGEAIYEREEIDDAAMPYIVVVIDEMADLMMVAGKDIEYAVQRLSQMARAAGIHLIMATQRPSVDVITGTIKANFPSRVSFQVTSKIDSRTILGEQGAEQLLGAGDMLSMAAGGRIMRAHGPFVSDEEVERVVNFLREQAEPDYFDGLLDEDGPIDARRGGEAGGGREPTGEALYDQAVEIVLKERRATTSYLQRRLGIGYNRAASLIERMEEDGLISPPNRTGKREIRGSEGD